jgi:hypothetical protein
MKNPILNHPEATYANTQQDLLRIANKKESRYETEEVEHPVCQSGLFQSIDPLERMNEETFTGLLLNLMRTRPTTKILDLLPSGIAFKEQTLFSNSPDFYRRNFFERATLLGHEFAKNQRVVGMRVTSENIPYYVSMEGPVKSGSPGVSVVLYIADMPPAEPYPITITRVVRLE